MEAGKIKFLKFKPNNYKTYGSHSSITFSWIHDHMIMTHYDTLFSGKCSHNTIEIFCAPTHFTLKEISSNSPYDNMKATVTSNVPMMLDDTK